MKVAVLGRGNSLKHYKTFSNLFEKIYITNDFQREIKAIGIKHFKGKDIIHVVGKASTNALSQSLYKRLGIKKITCSCFNIKQFCSGSGKSFISKYPTVKIRVLPKIMSKRGYPPVGTPVVNLFIDKYEESYKLCKFLEEKFSNEIKHGKERDDRIWPTTGSLAIEMALVKNPVDELYLFGFGSYLERYLIKPSLRKLRPHMYSRKVMRYHLRNLVEEFSDVVFYTSSNKIKIDCPNWKYIKPIIK